MDYEEMWEQLLVEMDDLQKKGVQAIHPTIVLSFMNFIEQVQEKKVREKQ